jgi:hypothetical protein
MTFELEADGVRVSCNSAAWTQRLVEKGARLVDPSQAEFLGAAAPGVDESRPGNEDPKTGRD